MLIKKRESLGLKHLIDSEVIIEYSNDMDKIYGDIEDCSRNKER